jgi:glycosyltransferase involved in cell wall biosynthesis
LHFTNKIKNIGLDNIAKKKVVNIYLRKSALGQFSIEKLFSGIVEGFKENRDFDVRLIVMPYLSKGFLNRVKNILFANRQVADIHHISGDIHYLTFAFSRKKSILTIHDLGLLYFLKGTKSIVFKLLWFTIPIWWTKKIIAISNKTRKDLNYFIKNNDVKISVIPNYIHEKYLIDLKEKNLNSPPIILHIGTAPHKNLIRLVDAVYGLDIVLHIVGILSDETKLLLNQSNISYNNYLNLSDDELIQMYLNSDIVYFASTFEGFGMPVLEGQALGIPVITSNISPMKELAFDGSVYFVNPYAASEIRNAILDILCNDMLRKNLILLGRKNAERYKIQEIINEYSRIYKELLNEGN